MKCIVRYGTLKPIRVSDDEAFQIVDRDGKGVYVSKTEWKKKCA